MAGLNLFDVQASITTYLQTSLTGFSVDTGSIPTEESLPFVNGRLSPYVILRYSDMMPSSGGGSFMGATHDEYYTYVDALCVGETDSDARELANRVNLYMLGKKFANASQIRKNFGGGQFAILSEAKRQPLAYIAVTSFRYEVNISDVGSGSLV